MSWNILFANPQSDRMSRYFSECSADLIAVQELTPDHVAALAADPVLREKYPHRILWDYGVGAGMGLLSRYPILDQGRLDVPPVLWARLDLGAGRTMLLVNCHPTFGAPMLSHRDEKSRHSWTDSLLNIFELRFIWYDPDYRDDGIERIRHFVKPLLARDEPFLMVGDFNVTEREPAYDVLRSGLTDVFRAVGRGGAATWRPERIMHLPLPLLRIDHMLCTPDLRPLSMWVDRTPRGSDHCPIQADFAFPPAAGYQQHS